MNLFFAVCVPVRILLSLLVRLTPRIPTSVLLGVIAVGFIFRYLTFYKGSRGGLGGIVWWNDFRPLHAFLYLLSACFVWSERQDVASYILMGDVLFSATTTLCRG